MHLANGTLIGKTMVIRGEISGAEDILLNGIVDGNITLHEGRLTVGAEGHAKAKVEVREVVIAGRVEGSVRAKDKAELRGTASFIGDLSAPHLLIEGEAMIKASLDTTEGREIKAAKGPKAVAHTQTRGRCKSSPRARYRLAVERDSGGGLLLIQQLLDFSHIEGDPPLRFREG